MAQFKTLLLIAALFIVISIATSPCKPGYVPVQDCLEKAVDPADGNCWWGYEGGSCLQIYGATSQAQCSDWCYSCLSCVYNYGCCADGATTLYSQCYQSCVSLM